MKYYGLTKYALISILILTLSACGGGGSGGANPFDEGSSGGGGSPMDGGSGSDDSGDDGGSTVTVTITSPVAGGTIETPDETVSLAGTASSKSEIVSVSWKTDTGAEGTASGSESWEAKTIPLGMGDNTITITAADSAGAKASRTVVVKREAGTAQSVTLNWQAPTTREDGSALTDLAGYYIHYGRMSETYDYEIKIDNPGLLSYVVENLSSGTWFFVASAYDSTGLQSNFSNEISHDVP